MINATNLFLITFLVSVSGSALHGPCETNDHCGTLDTFCKNGTCACRPNFGVFDDHCIQLAAPAIPCTHKGICKTTLGHKGICWEKSCGCRSFHHLYNKQCIKSKGLDEECDAHHQCYCGQDCNDKIQCENRICTCKPGFKKYSRRCILDPNFRPEIKSSATVIYSFKMLVLFSFLKNIF